MTVDEVEAAVKKELEGPGKLLGYRVLHKKIQACLSFECHEIWCMGSCIMPMQMP